MQKKIVNKPFLCLSTFFLGLLIVTSITSPKSFDVFTNLKAEGNDSVVLEKIEKDPSYDPTTIVNGDFETMPWLDYYYDGARRNQDNAPTDKVNHDITVNDEYFNKTGWNTSERIAYKGTLFEWITNSEVCSGESPQNPFAFNIMLARDNPPYNVPYNSSTSIYEPIQNKENIGCVEMNASSNAVLYQDLKTYSRDIIRWTLDHAVRTENKKTVDDQAMHVEVGQTPMDGNSIIHASGTKSKIDTNLALYDCDAEEDDLGDYGYGKLNELTTLNLNINDDKDGWKKATGVYIIPDNQNLTRFAFICDIPDQSKVSCGNLLDNITFSTLVGNLKAYKNEVGQVIVTGYWGEIDKNKKLCLSNKDGDKSVSIDMSKCIDEGFNYFKATVTSDFLKDETAINIYHEDYPDAKTEIEVVHPHTWKYTASGNTLYGYCVNTVETDHCDYQGEAKKISISINGDATKVFDGKPYDKAKIVDNTAWFKSGQANPTFYYEGRDGTTYTQSTTAPTKAGKYYAEIIGTNADGSKAVAKYSFEITQKSLTESDVTFSTISDQKYTGSAITPDLTITLKGSTDQLVKGTDFKLDYSDNINAGTAKIKVTFLGNYTGEVTRTFTILPLDKNSITISLSQDSFVYSGEDKEPVPTLTFDNGVEVKTIPTSDYDVDYQKNRNPGTAKVLISFKNGNYPTSMEKEFTIEKADAANLTVELEKDSYPFTGKEIMPKVTSVKLGNTDIPSSQYTISYDKNINATEAAEVTIEMKEDAYLTGSKTVYFKIVGKDMGEDVLVYPIKDYTYTGKVAEPHTTIKDASTNATLVEGTDYTITSNDINVGMAKAAITFIGNYSSTEARQEDFRIVAKKLTKDDLTISPETIPSHQFDGNPYEPKPSISWGDITLEAGKDFEYKYKDNTHVGDGTVTIVFKGNYEGSDPIELPFKITPKVIENPETNLTFSPSINPFPDQEFTGDVIEPKVEIKDGDKVLEEGKDYIIHCDDKDIGDGEFTIEFIGDYEGTDDIEVPFKIVPMEFDITCPDVEYTGKPAEPHPVVRHDGKILVEGADYTVSSSSTEAGEGTFIIHFIGDYEGNPDETGSFNILPKKADPEELDITIEFEDTPYTGEEIKPEVTVKDGDETLEEGVDYYIIYEDNVEPGEATVHIIFTGNYSGTEEITETFIIKPTSLDNRTSKNVGPTVVLEYADGFDLDVELKVVLKDENKVHEEGHDYSRAFSRFHKTLGSYDIKLYRGGVEIQPSELKAGAVLKLKILLPENIKGLNYGFLHIHNDKDIIQLMPGEQAGIGTYIIDEEGYMVTLINKLSDFSIIYETSCFAHWFMLTIAILDVILLIAILLIGKKPNKFLGIIATAWLIVLTAVSGVFAHDTFCVVMICINAALVVANILFFLLYKRNEKDPVAPTQITYVAAPAVQQAPEAKEAVKEAPKAEEPVKEEEPAEDLSLKESIKEAKEAVTDVAINKLTVASFLKETYGNKVEINTRDCMTSTGLPLGDTHYCSVEGQRKCFIYVYELEGKVFFIVRSDDEVAKAVKNAKHKMMRSAFPKTRDYAKWYTMLIDNSYANSDDVFATLKYVVDNLMGIQNDKAPEANEAPVEEDKNLSLKESISAAKANETVLDINKKIVADWLRVFYAGEVEVNNRECMTSTGLPLGDTHYITLNDKRKCFIYVYEIEGKTFFIVRSNDEIAKAMRAKKHSFIRSDFPKTRDYARWYTMLIDNSYASNDEVFDALKEVISGLKNADDASLKDTSIDMAAVKEDKPVEEEKKEEPVVEEPVEEEKNLSLKESIKVAKENGTELNVDKNVIADWLKATYADQVEVNVRENMTSTGLPLADTHYLQMKDGRKCFMYVYNIDGNCFLIMRGNDEIAKDIKRTKHKFIRSEFPKTRDYARWYTMIIDSSYKTNEEMFATLGYAINGILKADPESLKDTSVDMAAVKEDK